MNIKNRVRLMEVKTGATRLRDREDKNYTREELNTLARAAGIMYSYTFKKTVLAQKLGL